MGGVRRKGVSIVAALLTMGGGPLVSSAAGAAAAPPTITFPTEGSTVDQGPLTVRGSLSGGSADVSVVYVVDVSGSTSQSGYDCTGDDAVDERDDLNGNGSQGEILDCEIAGVVSLNTQLAAIAGGQGSVAVGLVPFGTSAVQADVGGQDGSQSFVSPVDDKTERDRTADIVQAVASMTPGQVALFEPKSVGTSTNFSPALDVALDALEARTGPKYVFMLSDGFGTLAESTIDRVAATAVEVRTFAVGTGSDRCAAGGGLSRIAAASGATCTYTEDPSNLSSAINATPPGIERVAVSLDGGAPVDATIDPLGNFAAHVFVGSFGRHAATVTVYADDGTSASSRVSFTAKGATRYVALGDSYSAGEGIPPYADVPGAEEGCHQSKTGYPTFLGDAGFEIPGLPGNDVELDYVACSGALLRNVMAVSQSARGEDHIVQLSKVDASADLVTMTIGGNDLGFSEIVSHCATQFDCWEDGFARLNSGRHLSADEFLTLREAIIGPQLQAAYRTLRDAPDNNATVVVADYPELMDDGIALRAGCKEALVFDRDEREWLNGWARTLSGTIERSAEQAGVWSVSVIEEFRGHRVCDGGVNTRSEWLTGHETALNKKLTGDASFHPDQDGAKAYARAISGFLRKLVADGKPTGPAGLPLNPQPEAAAPEGAKVAAVRAASVAVPQSSEGDPAVAVPTGYTVEELSEIASMTFGEGRLFGLSGLRGDASCGNVVAAGEQIVFEADGFAPGTSVEITSRSATDEVNRRLGTVTADDTGSFRVSIVVPPDLLAGLDDPDVSSLVTLKGAGTDIAGGERRVSSLSFVAAPGSACERYITAAGDIIDGTGAAPSAAETPGVPDLVLIPESLEQAYGCDAPASARSNGGFTVIQGTNGDDVLIGTEGRDVIFGGAGDDVLCGFDGSDILVGSGGDDVLIGNAGHDILLGDAGHDILLGNDGNDILAGGRGDDLLLGQGGNDLLIRSHGDDRTVGGPDTDYCFGSGRARECERGWP